MGDRGQVFVKDVGVYLYTHWGATGLVEVVREAIARRLRWDDPEYLARIVFCEMVAGHERDETGFGIGSHVHEDVWRLVELNCEGQMVRVFHVGYDDSDRKVELEQTFEEFVQDA